LTRADDSYVSSRRADREHDDQNALAGISHKPLPSLADGVLLILHHKGARIVESKRRHLEADAMLERVALRLVIIPFKRHI